MEFIQIIDLKLKRLFTQITVCTLIIMCYSNNIMLQAQPEVQTRPEQIHLAYGDAVSELTVTWVTLQSTNVSVVEYGTNELQLFAKGNEEVFVDGGNESRKLFLHRVKLEHLKPDQKYFYHVGSPLGWSDLFFFKTVPLGSSWSPRFAIFGDMGNSNAQSLGRLQEETQAGHFDAALHVGDFAYDMDTDNARVGDEFMNQIQSIAAYIPYMTCVGNHEQAYNFSNYKNRFTMPGGDNNGMFYSFDVGPVHFVAFSSEFYYFYKEYGSDQIRNQYKWMEQDLQNANEPEHRAKRPWIVTMCHRPMYCSNDDGDHCENKENYIRVGVPVKHSFRFMYGMEELLYKYGVDVHIQAHEHSYERFWPVYKFKVCNGTRAAYTDPSAPVHMLTGSAGCKERVDPFVRQYKWSAFKSDDYGYTRMTVHNSTHLYMEQVSDDKDGAVIDKVMVIKNKHGAGTYTCDSQLGAPTVQLL